MNKPYIALLTCLIAMTVSCLAGQAEKLTDFEPGKLWPDNNGVHINAHGAGVILHRGIYYWFGEHKIEGKKEFVITRRQKRTPIDQTADGGVHCYSSSDLLNWKDEGVVLPVDYSNVKSDIAYGCILERPKVLYNEKNNNFVMFFKLYLRGTGYGPCYTGVAVADNVTGPFKYSHKFLGCGSKAGSGDFALFKEDDGAAYHICSNRDSREKCIVKLTDDYLNPSAPYSVMKGIDSGTEAPAVFKRKNRYYLLGSGCTGWRPNAARSYSSDSLTGLWTESGNPCSGVNPKNNLRSNKTFGGQSTFVIPVQGVEDGFIAMFDMWRPENPIDGRYIWLPVKFTDKGFKIEWSDKWNLNVFEKKSNQSEPLPAADNASRRKPGR